MRTPALPLAIDSRDPNPDANPWPPTLTQPSPYPRWRAKQTDWLCLYPASAAGVASYFPLFAAPKYRLLASP